MEINIFDFYVLFFYTYVKRSLTMEAVKKAVSILGSQQKLADSLGVSKQLISSYVNGRAKVTAVNAKKIEELTGIKREEIRPDLFL